MKKFMIVSCSTFLVLLLSLALTPQASAQLADIGVNQSQRFYYDSACIEMEGTLSAERNSVANPAHTIYGVVDNAGINVSLVANEYGIQIPVSLSQTSTPSSGVYYRARCYEIVYANRYGFNSINFMVYGGI